jgi:hypothetical protein
MATNHLWDIDVVGSNIAKELITELKGKFKTISVDRNTDISTLFSVLDKQSTTAAFKSLKNLIHSDLRKYPRVVFYDVRQQKYISGGEAATIFSNEVQDLDELYKFLTLVDYDENNTAQTEFRLSWPVALQQLKEVANKKFPDKGISTSTELKQFRSSLNASYLKALNNYKNLNTLIIKNENFLPGQDANIKFIEVLTEYFNPGNKSIYEKILGPEENYLPTQQFFTLGIKFGILFNNDTIISGFVKGKLKDGKIDSLLYNQSNKKSYAATILTKVVDIEVDLPRDLLEKFKYFKEAQISHLDSELTKKVRDALLSVENAILKIEGTNSFDSLSNESKAAILILKSRVDRLQKSLDLSITNDKLLFTLGSVIPDDPVEKINFLESIAKNHGLDYKTITTQYSETNTDLAATATVIKVQISVGDYVILPSNINEKLNGALGSAIGNILRSTLFDPGSSSQAEILMMGTLIKLFPKEKKKILALYKKPKRSRKKISKAFEKFKVQTLKTSTKISPTRKYSRKKQKAKQRYSPKSVKLSNSINNNMSLVSILNSQIYSAVVNQMKLPSLVYRTGRFAHSVEITNVDQKSQSIMFKYMTNPYEIFSATQGSSPWNLKPQRDPEKIIERAIKSLSESYISSLGNNIRTMRG